MDDPTPTDQISPASLCVLASGSSGNCSILKIKNQGSWLIDAGLGIRKTREALEAQSLTPEQIQGVILTHLDGDHCNPATLKRIFSHCPIHMHKRHRNCAHRNGIIGKTQSLPFDCEFELSQSIFVDVSIASHDELGVCAFRFSIHPSDGSLPSADLGFATDIGHATDELVAMLKGVSALAIESNYCPRLQMASDRPLFLKTRIMGGSGHLSNQQCSQAIDQIKPANHVILLHLSGQCNTPALAANAHRNAAYNLIIANQHEPSPWVPIRPAQSPDPDVTVVTSHAPRMLFHPLPPAAP